MLRFLRAFLRGIRPLRQSLSSIAADLRTIARVQELRLRLEHNEVLTDEHLAAHPHKDDQTELSWKVVEPEIDPQTGQPRIPEEDAGEEEMRVDWESIFGKRK